MDFGRVAPSEINIIDFKLPKEPYENSFSLSGTPVKSPGFYAGTSKWGRKEWIGFLYPKGTKDAQFLNEYVKHFNCIEFNATHYKLYDREPYKAWLAKTGEQPFLFCPKIYQGISHFGSFDDKQFLTDAFLDGLKGLGEKLGPIFLQVSDKFGPKRKEELVNYLRKLPKEFQFFLEVRHPDWFANKEELCTLSENLKKLKIGLVITDTLGRRDVCHMHLSIPKTFIRYVGNSGHATDYKRLDEWVNRIKYWIDSGLQEVYFFMHNHDEGRPTLELTHYFIRKLNEKCNAGLKELEFIDNQK